MAHLWQHPYVNVFKHFNIASWKKSTKEGEVSSSMDKNIKGTVFRVTGSIPAGNYIQLPKTTSQSLGLTGRYFYLMFRPIPSKYFVVHLDIATQDNLVVRISFSNLFKEFKSTSTWLQFPFVTSPFGGSVHSSFGSSCRDNSGPTPMSVKWTVLCLDFHYILSMYLNRKFSYLKSIRLCANMTVKNIFTSDMLYDPGMTLEEAKRRGLIGHGVTPMPREMAYPLFKGDNWHDNYDLIRFPSDGNKKPHDSIQPTEINSNKNGNARGSSPKRIAPRTVDVSKCVSERVSMIHKLTSPRDKPRRQTVTSDLPSVGLDNLSIQQDGAGEVHIFAHPDEDLVLHYRDRNRQGEGVHNGVSGSATYLPPKPTYKSLEPDPILKLKRIVGFGGGTYKEAIWTLDGSAIIYPCHAIVVIMKVTNGHQRFLLGHTDKVSCLSVNGSSTLVASGQTGQMSVVRIWKFQTGECLAMCKTHVHSLSCLSFSHKGNVLCGVGKDNHGKNMVVIWNTSRVAKSREVTVMAKAHSDVDISRMKIAAFDDTRMVSCGRDNIRLWRVKEGSLRSAPVQLGEYHNMEFTDISFEAGYQLNKAPEERIVYASSRSGYILEIDYQKLSIRHVKRLLPTVKSAKREKETLKSGTGIGINSISVNETFCVTGSDDGYLRLWPLDFAHIYLEAEHEGPVTVVDMSPDGLQILAGTASGNLGTLDVSTKSYTTVMRSHTGRVFGVAVDAYRKHLATVSEDHTIRVWDADTLQQLYDFSSPQECPCAISYHPSRQIVACGFQNGVVRVFNVQTTSILAEHRQHRGKIIGLSYSTAGDYLYSACSLGSLALYDSGSNNYNIIRVLGNTVARGERHGPDALAVSPCGRRVAFIGPSDLTVSIVDAKSLDEVMKLDISNINPSNSLKTTLDMAVRVAYAPYSVGHLLVTTSENKLIKFDAKSGRLLTEVEHIHRGGCTSLTTTSDGRYLATAGDRVVKIWDYAINLDINFQVFIGHSENICRVLFTPDGEGFLSVGEAVYLWDFLAVRPPTPTEGRQVDKKYGAKEIDVTSQIENMSRSFGGSYTDLPRHTPPKPAARGSPIRVDDLSSIYKHSNGYHDDVESCTSDREIIVRSEAWDNRHVDSDDEEDQQHVGKSSYPSQIYQQYQRSPTRTPVKKGPISPTRFEKKAPVETRLPPAVHKHFTKREKVASMAQRRYTAPPNQAGLKLKSVMGYNGNGRGNMVWHADTGLFFYSSGCVVVMEDLNNGEQKHLMGHVEEISTIALQNDCQMLVSASGSCGLSNSQLCFWDVQQQVCRKVINHHEQDVVCLAYSRDDRFLISVGDYRECSVVVWCTHTLSLLASTRTAYPVYDVKWDPYTVNEFASVGERGTILFWLLDETTSDVSLNVHEAEVPEELQQAHHMGVGQVDFTSLVFAGDSTLYVGSNNGKVSAWDTRHNTCFMHWEADSSEIGLLISRGGRLLTASVGRNVRLWSVVGVGEMRLPGESTGVRSGGLTMEDEMTLDGPITCTAFDDNLDMGIVGTGAGTLWYINWSERTSIRLVSGHMNKVNCLAVTEGNLLASCADDGSVRVWSVTDREQVLQFQVMEQSCTCLAFAPNKQQLTMSILTPSDPNVMSHSKVGEHAIPYIVAGYSDGTVRMYDVNKVEMVLKMHPHAVTVTAISFSSDGRMIISGGSDGLIAVSSPTTGMTVRVITDHNGTPITNIDVTFKQDQDVGITAPLLWLATSADRRVSVWSADWSKDFCELVDWMTFPAPAFAPDGSIIDKEDKAQFSLLPPSIARFSPEETDLIVYTGYGMHKHLQFYSLSQRKVVRTTALTHWANCLDLAADSSLIAVGTNERLLKLMDYYEGSFQDFIGHNDSVNIAKFSHDGKHLLTSAYSEIFVWEVTV
ncbi:WD repeat-containing protein 90-like isoform X1 [Haliotis rufescens]|uniref:WD repeat-containing protein 90-like isoform X1 n=2 Tax=Haliotis rufescens TaxID=6454 RepID=UPI00201F881F|nr:WD repeat-containing protein 90-like isoform X1 [Haliotis rufescens]